MNSSTWQMALLCTSIIVRVFNSVMDFNPSKTGSCHPPEAPSRRFQSTVSVKEEPAFQNSARCNLQVYVKHINDKHVERMKEIVTELPSLVKTINDEARRNLWAVTRQTLRVPTDQIAALQAEAWEYERWRTAVLRSLPCLTMKHAEERCDLSPWEVEELLILPHGGRKYVPSFQFLADNTPSPRWVTLMSVLLTVSRFDNWDLFGWLVRPNVFLKDQSPLVAMEIDPKRVIFIARQIERDAAL